MFRVLEPKLDLLLIGIGDSHFWDRKTLVHLSNITKNIGVKAEILTTKNAVSTYNFMMGDYRVVAGAFLPTQSEAQKKLLLSERQNSVHKQLLDYEKNNKIQDT